MKVLLLALLALIPAAADAQLWDILLEGGLESAVVRRGEAPAVSGRLVDHAGDPVSGASVAVRIGSESSVLTAGEHGEFRAALAGFDGLPGTYVVNMVFSSGEKRGAASERLQVSGAVLRSAELARQLETPTAQRYLGTDEYDHAGDPLGPVMHRHYAALYKEYEQALAREAAASRENDLLREQMEEARLAALRDIEEKSPGAGTFSGWRHDRFVANLDSSVRGIIVEQLGHASLSLERARAAMAAVLDSGGTRAEARAAYLGHLGLSQAQMESVSAGLPPISSASGSDEPALSDSATAVPVPAVSVDVETGRVTVSAGGLSAEFVPGQGRLAESD